MIQLSDLFVALPVGVVEGLWGVLFTGVCGVFASSYSLLIDQSLQPGIFCTLVGWLTAKCFYLGIGQAVGWFRPPYVEGVSDAFKNIGVSQGFWQIVEWGFTKQSAIEGVSPHKKILGISYCPPPPFVLPATKLLAFKAFTLWYPRVCHKTFELTFGNLSSLSNISGVFCSLHNVKYTGLALAGIGTSYSFCAYALSFIYTPTVSELPTLVLPTHLHLGSPTEYQVM